MTIDQPFLVQTTAYVLVPVLMVVVSLLVPARINRPLNIAGSLLYALFVVVAVIGETWAYYVVGTVAEVLLLLTIAAVAWTWPALRPSRHTVGQDETLASWSS